MYNIFEFNVYFTDNNWYIKQIYLYIYNTNILKVLCNQTKNIQNILISQLKKEVLLIKSQFLKTALFIFQMLKKNNCAF